MPERRLRGTTTDNGPAVSVLAPANEARLLIPDLDRLQELQYVALASEQQEYARSQDEQYPFWSICHFYRVQQGLPMEACWRNAWENVAQMYIQHSLTLEEIARFSGIPLRSVAGRSGKYGWAQAKRTRQMLKENEDIPNLKDLEEEVRREKIAEFLTQSAMEVSRHAMQALVQNPDKIEARDIAALLGQAQKMFSMGTGMPETYRHSRVENPLAAGAQVTTNNFALMSPEKMVEFLESLQQRKAVLEQAALEANNPRR